ncbi:MAG: protein kinase family protein [Candidatus Protochlamydia sp.]|nr:protein kinase family protein [Candidatus Protochlamydia sp.]
MLNKNLRTSQYQNISKHLENLSDTELLELLKQGTPLQSGWGSTIKLEINGFPIFVKQVPLNEIEGEPHNIKSTKNSFDLPVYYQYGVNSGGFSVWRELSAHEMTTKWVLAGETDNFPLMFHWRILNNFQEKKPFDLTEYEKYVAYWENSSAIGQRMKANHQATSNVVLFIEYIPETLKSWLKKESKKGNVAIDKAMAMVEQSLQDTTNFLRKKEMLHFDAHFHNILTDGERLYFSDFGLAISSKFALSKDELQFFQTHLNYDCYYVATKVTNWIVANSFGKDSVDKILQLYVEGKTPTPLPESLTPFLSSIVRRYAPLTLKMNHFFESLTKQTKNTPYPAKDLDRIWAEI